MLKKVIRECYRSDIKLGSGGGTICKITASLADYLSESHMFPAGELSDFIYEGEIPSIPGGKLTIREGRLGMPVRLEIRTAAVFEYLEGSPEEDLQQVRRVLLESGLDIERHTK